MQTRTRRALRCPAFLLGALCALSSAHALERGDISFYLSFEEGLQPEIATGPTRITCSAGKPEEVPFDPAGLRGRAVKFNDMQSVSFHNAHMFSRKEGTISFWLKPIGWKAGSGKNHTFLHLHPDNCGLQIYRFYPGNNWAYLSPSGDPKTWRFIGGARWWDGWEDGIWQHVAFTFKPGEQAIYFGGKLHERKATDLVEPEFAKNNGLTLAAANRGAAQAFDEVLVFKRALSETEVQSLARPPLKTAAMLRAPRTASPQIDGRNTSDHEWQHGHILTGWVDPVLGAVNADETQVTVAHSGSALHIRFLYAIPEKFRRQRDIYVGSPLKVTVHQPDGDLFQDDYFGVHVAPPDSKDAYFFAINGAGARRDEKNGDAAWNGTWQANQTRDDHVWTAEFTIPFSTIGPVAAPGARWGVNFAHGCRQMDRYEGLWCYAPRTQRPLATLLLSSEATSVSVAGLSAMADGKLALAGKLTNAGLAPVAGRGELSIRADEKVLFTKPIPPFTVPPGAAQAITAEHALSAPACGDVVISIADQAGAPLLACNVPFVYSRELAFKVRYYPTPARLEAVIDAGSSAMLARIRGAKVSIVPVGGTGALHSKSIDRFDGLQHEVGIDCDKLPAGRYDVLAEVAVGDATARLQQPLVKEPPPEWLGNTLGTLRTVPKPWTPLQVTDRTIRCWGREYTFGPAGLPEQVRILGQEVLAGPARLVVTSAGQTHAVPLGEFHTSEASPLKVAVSTSGRAGNLTVSANAWIEFDGLYVNRIMLSAAQPVPVDGLAIEIPIKPEFAGYWSPAEYYPVQLGRAPKQKHESAVCHGMRVGNEERGLQFSRVNAKKQVLLPGPSEYVVRYEFLDSPTTIEKPRELTFGLQALPVRPRSPLYRSFKVDDCTFASDPAKELFNIAPLYTEGWSGHWNYLNFWNEQAFDPAYKERLKAEYTAMWHKRRQTQCMYLNIVATDANTPEYRTYRYEWAGKDAPDPLPYDPATKMKAQMATIHPATPSYEDFYMWQLNKTVRYLSDDGKYPIHCYLDCTASHRGYMKRLYTIMKAVHPLNQVFVHMSGDNNMDAWAFCDWLIEGEENTSNYHAARASDPTLPENYTRILDLPKVASRYSPYAFGDKFFLYQFWGWKNSEPARAHLWALLFVHDGTTWAAGGPASKQALTDLGWNEQVEFVPYWRRDSGLRVTSPVQSVVASGWKRGSGNLLVMVLNDRDAATRCELSVDFPRHGFTSAAIKCVDYGGGGLAHAESFQAVAPKSQEARPGQPIPLEIGRHSYRMLRFSQ